jgi:hypothetical protein
MKKCLRRILIAVIVIGLTLAGLYEYATHVGRGWLRGEAFFDGRPTSWWRQELEQWEIRGWHTVHLDRNHNGRNRKWIIPICSRQPTWLQQIQERWLSRQPQQDGAKLPIFLTGDDDALPVLRELLDDSSPTVRRFAQIGLGLDPEFPDTAASIECFLRD